VVMFLGVYYRVGRRARLRAPGRHATPSAGLRRP
jgi:hypothetical protein